MSTPSNIPFETVLEITKKKAQYGRYIDTKKWDQFCLLALPNARFRFRNADNSIITRDGQAMDFQSLTSFVDWFSQLFENAQTLHMFGPPEMSLLSKDEVSVSWSMEDQIYFHGHDQLSDIRGGGYYSELWVRKDDSWWLQDLTLTRTYQKLSIAMKVLSMLYIC